MERVTTSSDIELVVVQLTKEGRAKVSKGASITMNDIIDPKNKYIKVRCRVKGNEEEFIATKTTDNICTNCYESKTYIGGIKDVPCIVVTIPSYTFKIGGALEASVTTKENNTHFVDDNTKDTESIFEKTEVFYVSQ